MSIVFSTPTPIYIKGLISVMIYHIRYNITKPMHIHESP